MLKKGWMSRFICPGMSNSHHGSRNNNEHSVPYNANHLMSPTHCIIIDTNASGQNNNLFNDKDGIYAVRAIMIGNETMDDMVGLMVNSHGCVVPVIMDVGGEAKEGHARC